MTNFRKMIVTVLACITLGSVAFASTHAISKENDASSINAAKISLIQAINIATEKHPNGKTIRAEFEHSKKEGALFEIEVLDGQKVFDVKVDAVKGVVISNEEDKQDSEDEKDDN